MKKMWAVITLIIAAGLYWQNQSEEPQEAVSKKRVARPQKNENAEPIEEPEVIQPQQQIKMAPPPMVTQKKRRKR
ncbi:MAG: hypothetical protein AAF203_08645, partial [Pseudomonadota bacterium]